MIAATGDWLPRLRFMFCSRGWGEGNCVQSGVHRIRSAEHGNFGDCESVGEGVFEMRVHVGPGYRAYFTRRAEVVYLLLLGGDKSSQKRDIKRAVEMARILGKE